MVKKYIHEFLSTPSARRATISTFCATKFLRFLSTPSARRATNHFRVFLERKRISIHALREEGDCNRGSGYCKSCSDFYPRPPRGGRPWHEQAEIP